jgi:hypothetical protein
LPTTQFWGVSVGAYSKFPPPRSLS